MGFHPRGRNFFSKKFRKLRIKEFFADCRVDHQVYLLEKEFLLNFNYRHNRKNWPEIAKNSYFYLDFIVITALGG